MLQKSGKIIDASHDGYISPADIRVLLDAAEIPRVYEAIADNIEEAALVAKKAGYPLVMKVVGPLHKSDVGGVVLDVKNEEMLKKEFPR